MRRILLLVCLIVSVVELDWERQRIYLLSSAASLLLLLYGELMRRRKIQRVPTEREFKSAQGVPSEVYAAASPDTDNQAEVCSGRTQADYPERSRMLDCV
jgi:uncharacterized protein (DUF58 family)